MSEKSASSSVGVLSFNAVFGTGMNVIAPDWPAPDSVKAFVTTRAGGVSKQPFDSLNLGDHVGDDLAAVRRNRVLLKQLLPSGIRLQWLKQVHGTHVVQVSSVSRTLRPKTGDAAVIFDRGVGAVVMTADCLPVFFTNTAGSVAAIAHAGWRGLLNGMLEKTIESTGVSPADLMVWMGPAIAPCHFEVGLEVRDAFLGHPQWGQHFVPGLTSAFISSPHQANKSMMDIYAVARARLLNAGVQFVGGGGLCTVCEERHFFSYRRDHTTGRMASLIYLNR
jgi:YfiH family protein